jgi:hypothetical protein
MRAVNSSRGDRLFLEFCDAHRSGRETIFAVKREATLSRCQDHCQVALEMPIEDKCGTGAVATQTIGDCRLSIGDSFPAKDQINNWKLAIGISHRSLPLPYRSVAREIMTAATLLETVALLKR